MSISTKKYQLLQILSQNLANRQPDLISSETLANQLQISLSETQLLLKVMNDMGVVESSVDQRLTLITRKGIQCLNREIAL